MISRLFAESDEGRRSQNSVRRGLREEECLRVGILCVEHSKIHEIASKLGLACSSVKDVGDAVCEHLGRELSTNQE